MAPVDNPPRHLGIVWVLHPDWPTPPGPAPLIPAAFARLGPVEAAPLAEAMGQPAAEVMHRFEAGKRCYAALVEGALAAYGWVSFVEEQVGELRLRLRLAPGEAYIWDCATLPAYRRRRLYTGLLMHILDRLRAEGLCRAWIGTDADNAASQKGIALAGFRPVADFVMDWALAMRLVWVRGRPGVPEPLVADVRRIFLGDRDKAWLAALSAATPGQTTLPGD